METTKPDDCAFGISGSEHNPPQYGLTKREYFAGLAMQSFCYDKETKAFDEPTDKFYQMAALASVKMADALIEQLNKSK